MYFIDEYACLRLYIPPSFKKLAKNSNASGRIAPQAYAPQSQNTPVERNDDFLLKFVM